MICMKFNQTKKDWTFKEGEEGDVRSHFPIKVVYEDGTEVIVDSSDEIQDNVAFKVIETRVRRKRVKRE